MTKRRWTLWAAIILLAAGLALLDAYVHRHDAGTSAREALLFAMPPEASTVVFADLAELRRAPFATEFYNWIPKSEVDAEYADFLRKTGFDYEHDLDLAAIAVIKGEKEGKLFAIAEGRFDRKKIEAYAAQSGTRETRKGGGMFWVGRGGGGGGGGWGLVGKDRIALTDAAD